MPNTGEVHGQQCFVTVGSAAVLTACRERLPQTRGVVLCWGFFKELFCGEKPARPRRQGYSSPVARPRVGAAHPDPLRSDVTAWTQPSGKALLPCQQFFIMALKCTTWDGVSFYLSVGFSLLHAAALHSYAWASHFPGYFPFGPFFYQSCFLPGLCKITYLFPAAGLDLRCPAGSTLAASGG